MCTNSRFWTNARRWISSSGNFVLGIGTIILGLTALFKVKDITDAVNNVQDLNSTVISIRKLEHDNQDILKKIKDINEKNTEILDNVRSTVERLSSRFALSYGYKEPNEENKADLYKLLQQLTSVNGVDAYAQSGMSGSVLSKTVSSEYEQKEIDEIVNKWASFKTKEDRFKYLSNVFQVFFSTGRLGS